jgi:hypothetical protein
MPAAVAVPLITSAVGAGASIYAADQQRGAMNQAVGDQKALADRLYYQGMPNYGKKAKTAMWQLLDPQLQQALSGQFQQVMSPDLQNQQYAQLLRTFQQPYEQGRAGLEQSMENRGLGYGNVASKALGQYDQNAANTLANAGTDIATRASQLNYGAQQDQYNRLLNTYMNLFSQGNAQKNAWMGQGAQLQSGAINAGAANQGSYWSSLASGLGSLTGSLSGALSNYYANQPGMSAGQVSGLFSGGANALGGN